MIGQWAQRFATAMKRPTVAYLAAAGAVAVAGAVRALVGLAIDAAPPFMAFYPAILFATLVAGARGGLLATLLSAGTVWVLFLPHLPGGDLRAGERLQMAMFVLTSGVTVAIATALRVAILRGVAAEERFRIAQEGALDGFVILDPIREDGQIVDYACTYANPAADRLAPGGPQSLIGLRIRDVLPGALGEAMMARLRDLPATGADDVEVRQILGDGERWIRSSAVRLGDSAAVTYRDVSDQRTANATLRKSEARVRALVEFLPQLIWSHRPDGACDFLSPQWTRYTGAPAEQHYGSGWLDVVHPDDRQAVTGAWAISMAEGSPYNLEHRLRRHDGVYRWFDSRARAIRDDEGAISRWFGASSDITEITEARRDLEERVAERTRELEASLEERARTEAVLAQSQRLETVGRLTGGVAHDFNNLLTVVIGGLDMILRSPEDSVRVRRLAEAALAAGRRGERLTRQLLAFSRRQELKLETVAVRGLIDQVEPLVRRMVGEARELSLYCAPDVGACRLDAAQFEAALLNLVVNASDAVAGDGAIRIEAARVELAEGDIPDTPAGAYVRVTVADTGTGMTPEVLGRVFEPFFTTKEVGRGTGLGLAQVYGFVRQCGGGVRIESKLGEGTVVSLYLPASGSPPTVAETAPSAAPSLAARGARVLLVEDDEAVRAVTETLLEEMGCEVAGEPDGPSALRRLDAGERFDLLISDVVMPGGMTGLHLARAAEIRAPGMPIVLTTGYGGRRMDTPAKDLPWPVLRKPFRAEQLNAAVDKALNGAAQSA